MKKQAIPKDQKFPLSSLFPNVVTIVGLCFGVTSIRYALSSKWEIAVSLLVISAFIDGMDGRLARMLNASSKFGAELDSLADFVNFGLAPALIAYLWSLHAIPVKGLGWAICLLYVICCAIRLARFGAITSVNDNPNKALTDNLFFGIPAPAGAGLTLIPIMLVFQYEVDFFREHPFYLGLYLTTIAILMASRIPTFSAKNIKIRHEFAYPILVVIALFIIGLIIEPWIVLPFMGVLYILSIPLSLIYYHHVKNTNN
jgi:CDP-diacylglycerol--serine O-phosphatidyltransferase